MMYDFAKGAVYMISVLVILFLIVGIPFYLGIKFGWTAVVGFIIFIGGISNVADTR